MTSLSTLWLLVRRSLARHAVSTVVTIASAATASGLVISVFALGEQSRKAFSGGEVGFDAVLGAKGSELQLVLNAVFHLETSPGNLPWHLYQEAAAASGVSRAIPYAVGDSFERFRVVGTTKARFDDLALANGGRAFDEHHREAVIGATVAASTGLTVGASFRPVHGLEANEEHSHDEEYAVTGILRSTGAPIDRVIFIPIEGVFRLGGHVLRGGGEEFHAHAHEEIPDEHKEVSAVLLTLDSPQAGFALRQRLDDQGADATLAFPIGQSIAELFDKLGFVNRILELVAWLVMVVAAGSILAAITNTMNERRREFAVLRALGARRTTVFSAIVLEATTIAAAGAALGLVVYVGISWVVGGLVQTRTGVVLELVTDHSALVFTPLAMIALGAAAGLVPALLAYRTEVVASLAE